MVYSNNNQRIPKGRDETSCTRRAKADGGKSFEKNSQSAHARGDAATRQGSIFSVREYLAERAGRATVWPRRAKPDRPMC
jgi:hypothetical protein